MSNQTTFTKAIPVLPSLDLKQTLAFYVQRLKFTAHIDTDNYAGVRRDEIEIHFWLCADKHLAENSSCRIQVNGVEQLYQEYEAEQVIHPRGALALKEWGFKEFSVVDCNSNLIVFAEPAGQPATQTPVGVSESAPPAVSGIGGIFFKAQDAVKLREWYKTHLGIKVDDYGGAAFIWREAENTERKGMTIWSIFSSDTRYLDPSQKPFMLNYRVQNLDAMLAYLRSQNIEVDDRVEDSEFGRFGWAMDIEGNRIELWQPPEGL